VLLPEVVSRSLLSLRGDAGTNDPVFASPRGGHLTERAINYMLKRAAINAGINPKLVEFCYRLRRSAGRNLPKLSASSLDPEVGR
jgi:site-specific recombinase XerD